MGKIGSSSSFRTSGHVASVQQSGQSSGSTVLDREPIAHQWQADVASDLGGSHPDGAVHRLAGDLRLQTEPDAGKVPAAECLQSVLAQNQDFPDAVDN